LPGEVSHLRTDKTEMLAEWSTNELNVLSGCKLTDIVPVSCGGTPGLLAYWVGTEQFL